MKFVRPAMQRRNVVGRCSDQKPVLMTLPSGSYRIRAEAETHNGVSLTVDIPVAIKARQTTVVHLQRDWRPLATMAGLSAGRQAAHQHQQALMDFNLNLERIIL